MTTQEYSFTVPSTIPAGQVSLDVTNAGKEEHQAQLARINDGKTFQDLLTALQNPDPSAALQMVTLAGGPTGIQPGSQGQVVTNLSAGNYAFVCFVQGADGYVATAKDVQAELRRIGHTLSPLEIVVVNTSAGAKYGRQDYVTSGCGMGYEATMYLLERGVRLTGIDGWSWDAPFVHTAKKYAETKDASLIWEGHKAGRHIGYCHIEKLHNLEQLPPTGFTVSCFPVKIERASAGWTRAVAIIDS